MKRILVAYDGSESSEHALLFAIDPVAQWAPTEIHVLNVQDWPALYSEMMTTESFQQLRDSLIANGGKVLERATRTLAARKAAYQTHVRIGSPELAIVDLANRLCCEHIVMGTRGNGPVKSAVIGSVASKVVHLSELPVTLLK